MIKNLKLPQRLCLSVLVVMASASAGVAVPVLAHVPDALAIEAPLALTAESALHGVSAGNHAPAPDHPVDPGRMVSMTESSGLLRDPNASSDWSAVSPHLLDDIRGGFDTSLHLTLSFGIERAVYQNGALVTTTSFNLPALGGISHDDLSAMGSAGSSVALLQNGPNNTFTATPNSQPLAATIIQNTLNNQSFQAVTTINAAANSLQLLRTNAFHSLIRDGIGRAIAPH